MMYRFHSRNNACSYPCESARASVRICRYPCIQYGSVSVRASRRKYLRVREQRIPPVPSNNNIICSWASLD